MVALTVTLDRTSLTLGDLTIGAWSTSATFWVPEDGTNWPRFGRRKTRAPASPYLDGPGALLARVLDAGTFPFAFYAGGDTDAELEASMAEVQTAVDQWTYDLTLAVASGSRSFTAECVDEAIDWGEIDSGMVRARIVRGSVVIPLLVEV